MATVALRKIPLKDGRIGLYSDTWPVPPDGKRREALKIVIQANPLTPEDRKHNKAQFAIAKQLCQKRENGLSKPEIYSAFELQALEQSKKQNQSFVEFCRDRIRKVDGDSYRVYVNALRYFLEYYCISDIRAGNIDLMMIEEFADYLPSAKKIRGSGTLSQNSAATYFAAFKGLLSDAYKAGILVDDFSSKVPGLPIMEGEREPLTIDEVKRLFSTQCDYPLLKEAAMFSTLTGMRYSDIVKLEKSEIKRSGTGWYINFRQKKTGYENVLPISDEAYNLIPPSEKIPFGTLNYQNMQRPLAKWITDAGITRCITFHCFRHTFATLQASAGTDLLVLSRMMGHKSIRSTQVYAKTLLDQKVTAAKALSIS